MSKQKIQLSDHFTYPRLLRFVLPAVGTMLFTSIYGIVDGLCVSNFVGKTAFAAVNLIMPLPQLLGTIGFIDYPIAFKGYVATTFAEYVIDPKPRNRLWMVEDEQGLGGTIRVMDRGDSAQPRWFSVRPDWRENNLGNFLFGAAMEYIQENDFQKAWLSTFSESEIAVALYKRRGFRIMVATDVEIGGKNYREIVMEKSFLT